MIIYNRKHKLNSNLGIGAQIIWSTSSFATATPKYVNHGSNTSLDDLPTSGNMTAWAWIFRTANGVNQYLYSKVASSTAGWEFIVSNNGGASEGSLAFIVRRATTYTRFESIGAVVPLNTWTFVAATFDNSASPKVHLYVGGLTTTVAEVGSYFTSTAGTGSIGSDAAANLYVGDYTLGPSPFSGSISRGGITSATMSANYLRSLQYAPISGDNIANTKLLFSYYGSGYTQDYSGNSNAGTIVGSPSFNRVPLGSLFPG